MERLDKNDPEKIGPWQLIGRLGSGGMGEVFVATDGIQNVALKVFHKHLKRFLMPLKRLIFKEAMVEVGKQYKLFLIQLRLMQILESIVKKNRLLP